MSNPYFFMSYSREDTAKQRRIVKELRERGINIWVDIENLTPGTPTWEREIEKAIRGATGIIVLLSPESNNSEWVRREISFGELAWDFQFDRSVRGHRFLPSKLSHVRPVMRAEVVPIDQVLPAQQNQTARIQLDSPSVRPTGARVRQFE